MYILYIHKLLNKVFVYIYKEHKESIRREKHPSHINETTIEKIHMEKFVDWFLDYVSAQLIITLVERKFGVLRSNTNIVSLY